MKYILLMRHAKSSWEDASLSDFDRPLAGRGLKDAPRMGRYLRKTGYTPDYIVSSPAQRAKETTLLATKAMKCEESIINWDEDLYFSSTQAYLDAIRTAPKHAETTMLVGHNPLMESVGSGLSSGSDRNAIRMPTAGLICLESYGHQWESINWGSCQIKWMVIPRLLKEILK